MRLLLTTMLLCLGSFSALAAEKFSLKASVSLLGNSLCVGQKALIMVKLANTTQQRIYFDDYEFRVSLAIGYSDRTGFIGPYSGGVPGGSVHGGPSPIIHLHERTVGIEPGESIIRFAYLYPSMLVRPDRVRISAIIHFPGTSDPSLKAEDWNEYKAEAEVESVIEPEPSKH